MARRTAHRLLQTAVALVLTLAVFGGAVQAGRIYWYCTAMDATMSHACCANRGHSAHVDSSAAQSAAVVAPECCQPRSFASPEACTPNTRAEHELAAQPALAPPIAAVLAPLKPNLLAQAAAASVAELDPVKLRVHARVMVFLI